jgi:hypothetical protein
MQGKRFPLSRFIAVEHHICGRVAISTNEGFAKYVLKRDLPGRQQYSPDWENTSKSDNVIAEESIEATRWGKETVFTLGAKFKIEEWQVVLIDLASVLNSTG